MPPKGKIKKKKRKVRRQAPPQVALACSEGLARLFTSGRSASLALTRGDAMKRLWALAKERSLQQGATITCDAEMRALFGVDALGLTDVPGALAGHLRSAPSQPAIVTEAGRRAAAERLRLRADRSDEDMLSLQRERQRVRELLLARQEREGGAPRQTVAEGISDGSFSGASGVAESAGALSGPEGLREAKRRLRALREAGGGTSSAEYHALYARYVSLKRQLEGDASLPTATIASAGTSSSLGTRPPHSTAAPAASTAAAPLPPASLVAAAASADARSAVPDARSAAVLSPPEELLCPILMELMIDPVSTADGQCYERAAIERSLPEQSGCVCIPLTALLSGGYPLPPAKLPGYMSAYLPAGRRLPSSHLSAELWPSPLRWLRTHGTSPLTGLVLPSRNLLPNIPLRKMCADWRQRLETLGSA